MQMPKLSTKQLYVEFRGIIFDDCFAAYRDIIQSAISFAQMNKLLIHLEEKMLAHLCLRFRTDSEGLQQQEALEALAKAIQSAISHVSLISLIIQIVDLISSCYFYTVKVFEMKAEYFPVKQDVILQNEAPMNLYILDTSFH
ncbi:hypothetical protein FXO38_20145 [Capsicum annuum]|uniref:Uncharacterized protein n=1 Tax=Capsicum annuum TaxID=4072 RepID=A0A2G2ZJ07_CAPAN|nr:hypothetical protein FXO38_20145 [Capsicum annuum]KAF3647398.1 hypothetical protein FXO37_19995 [Capsicum annuum]PHT81915.1 hypothetical protein T459_14930 [Capsicum annuum]